tara:strand:- start:12776 stop:14038 length:1263 start_codon:yes stop_codon:yes gene_type:complete
MNNDLLVKPKSIKEIIIPQMSKRYEAYLYKYTNKDNDKMYVGIHKGSVNDEYWHSSTCSEFKDVCLNEDSNLKYEILEYGDWDTMTANEYSILNGVDAKNNSLYYNKSNGSPKYKPINLDKVINLANRINNMEFSIERMKIEDVTQIEKLQVRHQEDMRKAQRIADKIDESMSIDGCNPAIVWDSKNGRKLVDGNHTVWGVDKSKHANELDVMIIPDKVFKGWTDTEIRALANYLNPIPEVVKDSMSISDAVKFVVGAFYNNNVPTDDLNTERYLKSVGFTIKEIRKIIKLSNDEIEKQNMALKNQVWVDWGTDRIGLENYCEARRDLDTVCFYMSSLKFSWDRVMDKLWAATKTENGGRVKTKSRLILVMHHPTPTALSNWQKKIQSEKYEMLEYFINGLGYTFQFESMQTTRVNSINK